MAEVYSDKTGPARSSSNWLFLALLAVIVLAIIIAIAR
jgi:hypothetical protein